MSGSLSDTVHCIYISPIKALANDIQKNLIGPLNEIKERFLPEELRISKWDSGLVTPPERARENAQKTTTYPNHNS